MSKRRPNIPRIPKPESRPVKKGYVEAKWERRQVKAPAPIGSVRPEGPIDSFLPESVEARVQQFLSSKLNNPQPARATKKNAAHLITGNAAKLNDESSILPPSP